MSREVSIGARRFWVVSEPHHSGWKAEVLEVLNEGHATQPTGIETLADTRTLADERAIGQLQHRLREQQPVEPPPSASTTTVPS